MINESFPDSFDIKIKDLPKSFGCSVQLAVDQQSKSFMLLSRRMMQLVEDSTGQQRQICDLQPYPFTVSNLTDFSARINNFSFVFNVNDTLLNENSFYNSKEQVE
jgi:hypothetical protein